MEMEFKDNVIRFKRELSDLDKFVLDFAKLLNKNKIEFVVVSGYVSIVFGRMRTTEDVDILVEDMSFEKFRKFWNNIVKNGFECLNTTSVKKAYYDYLRTKHAIRFSRRGIFLPNVEFKFVRSNLDKYCLKNSANLILNRRTIPISPIELQIAYKLILGSYKDYEDAKFLFDLFRENLDMDRLREFLNKFKIKRSIMKDYLKGLL